MKSASAELIAYLESSQQFFMDDLYTFTLVGGFVARYTSYSGGNLTVGGNVFEGVATGPIFTRSRTRTVVGTEVDTLDITIAASPTHLLNGTPWLAAIRNGALDGATVKLERIIMPTPGDTSLGAVNMNSWRIAEVESGRSQAVIHAQSALELLNISMPRNLYQPGCLNTLFDGACTLVKASFGTASSVLTADRSALTCNLVQAAGYFDLGTVTFTSGENNGVTRSIRAYEPGIIAFMTPLVTAPDPGDTFTAYAGCDKKQATCSSKFSNLVNFRGFPYVPAPESIN